MNDHSMFSFLLGEAPTKSVDIELIGELAKEASSAYLGPNQTPLNHSVVKIAKSEGLSPEQISMVCQETNKAVHQQLFKTAEDKYIDFDLADPTKIVAQMEGTEKVASSGFHGFSDPSSDYKLAPGEEKANLADFSVCKTASCGHDGTRDNTKREKKAVIEKLAHKNTLNNEAFIIKEAQIESLEKQFLKLARNQILSVTLNDRRDQFPYITQFCKVAGMNNARTDELMTLLDTVMVRQGVLEKSADIKADASLISNNLNARVINGTHPLEIVVKTIVKRDGEKKLIQDRHNLIKTEIDSYKADGAVLDQEVKEL